MNAIMERWVRTCRRELLDRILIWDQRHLLSALREFEVFYNGHRPPQGIANARPLAPLPDPITDRDRPRPRRAAASRSALAKVRLQPVQDNQAVAGEFPIRAGLGVREDAGGGTAGSWRDPASREGAPARCWHTRPGTLAAGPAPPVPDPRPWRIRGTDAPTEHARSRSPRAADPGPGADSASRSLRAPGLPGRGREGKRPGRDRSEQRPHAPGKKYVEFRGTAGEFLDGVRQGPGVAGSKCLYRARTRRTCGELGFPSSR
jgi:hypothetical protein